MQITQFGKKKQTENDFLMACGKHSFRKGVATEAKGVCTPWASVRDISTARSVTEMVKRKNMGICMTKSLETQVCVSFLPRKKTSNF